MRKNKLLLVFFICCYFSFTAHGASVAIISTKNIPFSKDIVQQIIYELKQSSADMVIDTLYTEEGDPLTLLGNKSYDIICAIGNTAAKIANSKPQTPVVFFMAIENSIGDINIERKKANTNITGVFLAPEPQQQIDIIKKTLPSTKSIYLFHDGVSRETCQEISLMSEGINFTPQKIENPNKIPAALTALPLTSNEALWILPDSTIYNKDSLAFILNYSAEKHLPIIGFAYNIVKAGALLGYVFDYTDIGKQTAQSTLDILHGKAPRDITPQRIRKLGYCLNLKVAEYLKISIPPEVIDGADEIIK